jgi:single-strand DNA-binding protein
MLNKVMLIGNLGKDPEIRHLENGASVASFSVATNENYKDREGNWQTITEWHNVVAWRALAGRAERDFKKGSMVYVEGKLTTRKWQDQNGNQRYTTEVVANNLRLLEKRERNELGASSFPSAGDEPMKTNTQTNTQTANPVNTPQQLPEDDLPF